MTKVDIIYDHLTPNDFKQLKRLAIEEHKNFFQRNPHLKSAYSDSLIGICLCQGAAWHYVYPGANVGIKDFDIWLFYEENDKVKLRVRRPKTIKNGHKGRDIDFLRKAIGKDICSNYKNDLERCIMEYLEQRDTVMKVKLLKKSIIGLYPESIFMKVMWKGKQPRKWKRQN